MRLGQNLRYSRLFLIILCAVILIPNPLYCWGFYGHKSINRLAVFTLPTELIGFYKDHLEFISEHAVDPDMRRYVVKEEAPRHYIDIDHYGEHPFDSVPRAWEDAVVKFSEDTLQAYGIVPWHIERMYNRLVWAFKDKDVKYILKTSADLGHYVADAHVPLHTTENYNGQLTNQKGIHGFWESRLPELFAEDYNYFIGKAQYVESPLDYAWDAVEVSHMAVDSVLGFERDLNKRFESDRKYAFEQRGRSTVKVYSRDYSEAYHELLDNMVERRMRSSIIAVGSLWYSAWIEAGKPNLNLSLESKDLLEIDTEKKALQAEYEVKPVKSREHDE